MLPFLSRRALVASLTGAALSWTAMSSPALARTVKLVALGDSLTAGYLLPADAAFPVALERALKSKGIDVAIGNAGVSGDTTAGGLARLDWSVPDGVDGVILELGANDALRGLDPKQAETNLEAIIARLGERRIKVLLAGMLAPRNNGPDYVAAFDPIFARLAERHGLRLYPFFLDGVMGNGALMLADQIHPNRQGVETVVARLLPTVEAFIADIKSGR